MLTTAQDLARDLIATLLNDASIDARLLDCGSERPNTSHATIEASNAGVLTLAVDQYGARVIRVTLTGADLPTIAAVAATADLWAARNNVNAR